jgi:hypothetical protein
MLAHIGHRRIVRSVAQLSRSLNQAGRSTHQKGVEPTDGQLSIQPFRIGSPPPTAVPCVTFLEQRKEYAMRTFIGSILTIIVACSTAIAQTVLFDFDTAPLHSSLPVDVAVGGITAHLSATGQGFSIQPAGVLGFTPADFSGYCIYPNSIYSADLRVGFSQTLTNFSILYSPEEYGCDSSARMRATGYMNGVLTATNTMIADPPGTWPSATLSLSAVQGFNSVVVHYDAPPITGGDWGPVFMADNMNVTAMIRLLGDFNIDQIVNSADVSAMLTALTDLNVYQASHGFSDAELLAIGDLNASGTVTNADIQALLTHLTAGVGGLTAVPEPASIAQLALALPALAFAVACRHCK